MEPLVTVVIPTYNRVSLVGRAIASARSQRYLPLHIVVVDDGSTDATPALLASMRPEPSLTVVRHDMNRGASAAKNTGLDHMPPETAFFGILDSDDELRPGAVEGSRSGLRRSRGPFLAGVRLVRGPCFRGRTGSAPVTAGTISYVDSLCGRFAGEFWQLARADLLDGQRFDERALGGEGWLWTRLLRKAPAYLISDTVRHYDRSGPDWISIPAYDRRSAIGTMWAYRTFLDGLGKDVPELLPAPLRPAPGGGCKVGSAGWRSTVRRTCRTRCDTVRALPPQPGRRARAAAAFRPARVAGGAAFARAVGVGAAFTPTPCHTSPSWKITDPRGSGSRVAMRRMSASSLPSSGWRRAIPMANQLATEANPNTETAMTAGTWRRIGIPVHTTSPTTTAGTSTAASERVRVPKMVRNWWAARSSPMRTTRKRMRMTTVMEDDAGHAGHTQPRREQDVQGEVQRDIQDAGGEQHEPPCCIALWAVVRTGAIISAATSGAYPATASARELRSLRVKCATAVGDFDDEWGKRHQQHTERNLERQSHIESPPPVDSPIADAPSRAVWTSAGYRADPQAGPIASTGVRSKFSA